MKNIEDALNMVKMAKSHKCLCSAVDEIDRMFMSSTAEIYMSDDDWLKLNLEIRKHPCASPSNGTELRGLP